MSTGRHDRLCPMAGQEFLGIGCMECDRVRIGRRDGIRLALQAVDSGGRAAKQIAALLLSVDAEVDADA